MCGRFALANPSPRFGDISISSLSKVAPQYNISPGQEIFILQTQRILQKLPWGLQIGTKRMINARSESVQTKKLFRDSFLNRRCIVFATGFFEWDTHKNPYYFYSLQQPTLGFAGIYDKEVVILTQESYGKDKLIHNRFPVIINPEDYSSWLDLSSSWNRILQISTKTIFSVHPVSFRVNRITNNDKEVIQSIYSNTLF